jgi:RES domain-containing protein
MKIHPDTDRLRTALARCATTNWRGELFRSASPKYASKDDIVTGAGAKTAGGRWNPRASFNTVYASLDVETAVAEALQHFLYYAFPISKAMPRVIVALEAKLGRALDLRDGDTRRVLGVSERRMLDEPWRQEQKKGREALTQAIGRLAFEADIQGLLVPSAARKGGGNLILFPANLDPPKSWLRVINRGALPPKM